MKEGRRVALSLRAYRFEHPGQRDKRDAIGARVVGAFTENRFVERSLRLRRGEE